MTEHRSTSDDLSVEIAGLYGGPLDGFIAGRDSLARRLRQEGRREDVRLVKALRKPGRLAWALNVVATAEPERIDAVAAAVAAALDTRRGSGDLRSGIRSLREAVQELAATASRLTETLGQSIDAEPIVDAGMAVIANGEAFQLLRASRLVSVPEAGGLDLLAGWTPPPAADGGSQPTRSAQGQRSEPEQSERQQPEPGQLDATAVERLRQAERELAAAREQLEAANRVLERAEAESTAADRRAMAAQAEATARREELDRARSKASTAAAVVRQAEQALADTASRPPP